MNQRAVDSCVLLDVLRSTEHCQRSIAILENAVQSGRLCINEIVYAELSPEFTSIAELDRFLAETGIFLTHSPAADLYAAGHLWKSYLKRGGSRKQRIMPDFILAAFALHSCAGLITRDTYFKKISGLKIIY